MQSPTAAEESGLVDALLRYYYYAELGIDQRHVAPFREEWLSNALSMVPNQPPPNVSDVSGQEKGISSRNSGYPAGLHALVVVVLLAPHLCTSVHTSAELCGRLASMAAGAAVTNWEWHVYTTYDNVLTSRR